MTDMLRKLAGACWDKINIQIRKLDASEDLGHVGEMWPAKLHAESMELAEKVFGRTFEERNKLDWGRAIKQERRLK